MIPDSEVCSYTPATPDTGRNPNLVNSWKVTYNNGSTSKDVDGTATYDGTDFSMTNVNASLEPGNYTFTAYANIGSTTQQQNTTVGNVSIKLEGAAGIVSYITPSALSLNHTVVKAVPKLSLVNTRGNDTNNVNKLFGVKIDYPANGAGSDAITITQFNVIRSITTSPASTSISVIDANGVLLGNNNVPLSRTITLSPGQSAVVTFETNAGFPLTAGSQSAILNGIDFTVGGAPVSLTNAHANVAVWNDLQVNFRIAT